jgi:hypothetical protein
LYWLFPHRDALTSPTAQIIVGSGASVKTFNIHKQLLCDSSTYFRAALNNGFAETRDQKITLDDEEPAILETYLVWLYEGQLSKKTLPLDDIPEVLEKYLFKLYIFADKRGIGNLANDTITMLASYWSVECVPLSEVTWVILLISRNSKLYDLLLDKLVLELRDQELEGRRSEVMNLPQGFLFDLLIRSNELSECFNDSYKCYQAVCHYHDHAGQGIMNEEDCIRNIEAGWNTYHKIEALEQRSWEGDVDRVAIDQWWGKIVQERSECNMSHEGLEWAPSEFYTPL